LKNIKDFKKYTEANRKAWNEAMPKHKKVMDEKWDNMFSTGNEDFIFQKDEELFELNKIGFKGKRIAHLSCNNGIELLSLKKNGAGKCVGFDISDNAILEANKRAERFDINCEFIRTDVFEIPEKYYDSFDIVYVTVGALAWIPNLDNYFKMASNLLAEDGNLFIYEHHPFAGVFPYDGEVEGDEILKIKYPYFNDEIWQESTGIDYYGGTVYDSPTSYEFSYTIGELINSLIKNGIMIERFNEYEKDIALGHQELEKKDLKLPLCYILIGEKRNLC